jgi:hypothetical protein
MAIEAELPDGRILEFPDGTSPAVIQATVKRVLASGQPTPETTIGGQVKEAFKGLVPGAVGLLESAATGASALLPEELEKSARAKIASVAGAAKKPFEAAPGYEDTVTRKLSEAVGSTAPFLLAGPFGLAGRAAAVGLGVGAGAGEARTRAEQEGATADQRGTATALGTIPGALEAFAPLRILSRIPTASKAAGVEAVKRAMIAGGEEAAQEAASGFAQNLIARGVYKPEQALIEGLGEQAAYGGATGAIVQGLMDLALGRRAKGTQPTQPAAAQGEMFTPAEMGVGRAPVAPAAPVPPTEPAAATPTGQMDLGLDYQREVEQLYLERERLRQQPPTPEVEQRVADLSEQIRSYEEMNIAELRAQAEVDADQARQDAEGRSRFPALAEAPDLLTMPDEVKARTQGDLFGGEPAAIEPTAEEAAAPGEPTPVPPYARTGPYQYKLPLRGRAGELTMKDVEDTGIAPSTTRGWFEQNVVGKTSTEVQALVDADPTLIEGKGKRAKILRELLAPRPATFKEPTNVPPTAKEPAPEQRDEPRAGEPSVGVPSEPAAAVVPEPGAGVAGPAAAPVTPDGLGLVPAGQPAEPGAETQGVEPAAVSPFAQLMRGAPEAAVEEPAAPPKPKSPFDISGPSILTKDQTSKGTRYAAPRGTGQTLDDLTQEVRGMQGKLGDAARKMLRTGKLKLEEGDGSKAGLYDGTRATLYARGIDKDKAMTVLLHEVGAHMGMQRLLGQKQYDAVIDRILDMVAKGDGSLEARLAQSAYQRIPQEDMARGSEVARDEVVAYFVDGLAHAEIDGQLPTRGSLRSLWDQIKTAIITSLNRALGTTFGIKDLTPQQIADIALAAVVKEAETGVGAPSETKRLFAVSYGTESLIDSMGPLDPDQKTGFKALVPSFKAGMSPAEPSYGVKFRTQTADSAATIEHRLREQFDGAVRDSLGKLNPMGLYRQAQDYTKLLMEYFQVGGLVKDPATGLWVVQELPGVKPPVDIFPAVYAWGEKNGYDRDRAIQIASRVLEGVRLHGMLESNRTQGTKFVLHLKDTEINQLMAEYNADPELQALTKLMDDARIAMVDNMVAAGRLSPEQGKDWKDVSGYVPFDRIEDFATNFNKIKKVGNKGIAQLGRLPELVGSEKRPVGNVFENYINTLGWMVGQTMKNDATVQTLRSLEGLTAGPRTVELGLTAQGKPNVVGAYVNGEMTYWEVPSKYDVLAFKDLNPPKAGWLRNLGKFSNVLRKSVTVLPPFALKQVTDDIQRAIVTSGVRNPGALLRMSLSNFGGIAFAELRGIQHPSVKQFGRMGLTGEIDFETGKPAVSLLKDLGHKKRGKFETLLHRLDGITRASDLAVRKAIYDQTLKETNDQLLAQTRAREFINFRRRGSSDFVGALVTTIPFVNAYIQGMDVVYRAASGKDSSSSVGRAQARRFFWSRAATVMMLSSLYALGAGEDEDYQDMDLRTRDSNWILPGVGKLPVPTELGALFKVIPERIVEYMRRQGTPEEQTAWEATRTALTYMFEQYVGRTVPVPQAAKPLLEAWTNYSFFTGRELEGIYQRQQDPSLRRASNTSELAIAIANFSRDVVGVDKVSPILVDNALNGYFGSSAGLLVAMTDSLLNPTRVDRPLHKWALVSNYMYDPVGTRRMTEFYETREKVGRANATLNELLKTDLDRAAAYAEKNADVLMLEGGINSTLEQLERTRAYRKYLNSPDAAAEMPKEERALELQELRKMEVELTGWLREAKATLGY